MADKDNNDKVLKEPEVAPGSSPQEASSSAGVRFALTAGYVLIIVPG